ncbi:MAG: hypothetical protein R3C55_08890 [Parvularculaceae bacterium]
MIGLKDGGFIVAYDDDGTDEIRSSLRCERQFGRLLLHGRVDGRFHQSAASGPHR